MPTLQITVRINDEPDRTMQVSYARTVIAENVLEVANAIDVALDSVAQPAPPA